LQEHLALEGAKVTMVVALIVPDDVLSVRITGR
jgi:hypothetical protein